MTNLTVKELRDRASLSRLTCQILGEHCGCTVGFRADTQRPPEAWRLATTTLPTLLVVSFVPSPLGAPKIW